MNPLSGPLFIALGVLVAAGAAKLLRPSPTATALRAVRIPAPLATARLLGLFEIALGLGAAITGSPLLYATVAATYAAFTLFVLWTLNGNEDAVSCGCFGHEDTPPTPGHVAYNAAAAAIAGLMISDPVAIGDFDGSLVEGVISIAVIALGISLVIAALTSLPRTLAIARGSAPVPVPTFSIDSQGSSS